MVSPEPAAGLIKDHVELAPSSSMEVSQGKCTFSYYSRGCGQPCKLSCGKRKNLLFSSIMEPQLIMKPIKGADDSSSSNNVLAESDADEALTKVCHDQDQPALLMIVQQISQYVQQNAVDRRKHITILKMK
eukprot:Em0021g445a